MPEGYTERGFAVYTALELPDDGYAGKVFTVQESSLATERKLWVGLDLHRAHLNAEQVTIIRDALTEWLEE